MSININIDPWQNRTHYSPKPQCDVCEGRGQIHVRTHQDYRSMAWGLGPTMHPIASSSSKSFPCPQCSTVSMPYERLEVLKQTTMMDLRMSEDPGFVQHVKQGLTHDLAQHMLNHGYIHFDELPHNPMSNVIRATIGVVPKDKVLPVAKQMEQLEAKLTCICGDYVDHHSISNGHAPLSQYDYSLQRAEEENERLKGEIARLERRIEQVFP